MRTRGVLEDQHVLDGRQAVHQRLVADGALVHRQLFRAGRDGAERQLQQLAVAALTAQEHKPCRPWLGTQKQRCASDAAFQAA